MIESLISLLVIVLVVGIVVWLALWALAEIGLPDPFGRIARVLIVVIAALVVILYALPIAGISI